MKNKYIQIEFKYLSCLTLMEQIKISIEFFERGMS
jgi:hypothetical protein